MFSCLVLACPILSCLVLSCLVLSCVLCLILSGVVSCLVMLCFEWFRLGCVFVLLYIDMKATLYVGRFGRLLWFCSLLLFGPPYPEPVFYCLFYVLVVGLFQPKTDPKNKALFWDIWPC